MRDLRSDLQERAAALRQRIEAEDARFQTSLQQLKAEHDNRLETLQAQLRAVHKLIAFAAWHHNVRTSLLLAIAGAATAELSVRSALETRIALPS